jgi:hypothetical protein
VTRYLAFTLVAFLAAAKAPAQQTPPPEAAAWWSLTTDLANDSMEGRDTGSEAYERAAKIVAEHFKADSLKPAGDNGTYFQRVPLHEVDLDTAHSSVEIVAADGSYSPLALLYETTIAPRADLPALTEGQLVFLGYGEPSASLDLHGKIAVFFNSSPAYLSAADREGFTTRRTRALAQSGALAAISIDNPAATEPTHWPAAYAHAVTITGGASRAANPAGPLTMRISADAAPKLFAGTDANPSKIIADAEKGLPIPSLDLARKLRIVLKTTEKDISSPNILAILPGADPKLAPEYVAVSAHLDGYGYGTPVMGDNLYNGALDDVAYVATLIEMADKLHGHPPARSILFCIFTGEEKGLLGSVYYTQHLTVPKEKIVTDLNLDQLRPIFPLNILTMEGIADSTIGDTAKSVAKQFNIELRPDHETERRLFSRSDNYSFVRIGVPIGSFIFGYDPGTESERIYRDWYARRYHKPQDDLATPIDWTAAVKFNDFYRALTLTISNNPARPQWLPTSTYAPKP